MTRSLFGMSMNGCSVIDRYMTGHGQLGRFLSSLVVTCHRHIRRVNHSTMRANGLSAGKFAQSSLEKPLLRLLLREAKGSFVGNAGFH